MKLRFADGSENSRPGCVVHEGHVIIRLAQAKVDVCGADVLTRTGETTASPRLVALLVSQNLMLLAVDWATPPPDMPIAEAMPRERSSVRILNPLAPWPDNARVTRSKYSHEFHIERRLTDMRGDGIGCFQGHLAGIVVAWTFGAEFQRF